MIRMHLFQMMHAPVGYGRYAADCVLRRTHLLQILLRVGPHGAVSYPAHGKAHVSRHPTAVSSENVRAINQFKKLVLEFTFLLAMICE